MPQIFQVLCCYKCEMFQVQQVKKSNKWQCRVCNEKQSLKKAFKIGSSRDCRFLVQKLNMRKGTHVEGESENLEVTDSNNGLFESENDSSELPDCTERENVSCSFVVDNEVIDSTWQDDVSCSYHSDSVSKLSEENTTSSESDFLSENSRICENFHSTSDSNKLPLKVGNVSQVLYGQAAPRKVSKQPLENQTNALSPDVALPPFKKNKGFQIILNAASKLK